MDELLLQRARSGDPEAFEHLAAPLEPLIWRVCWHYTGDRQAAEDCAQEAMVRLWRNLDSYRGDCAFESWAYRIAANGCLDWLRKKKRDRSVSMEPLKDRGFDPADPGPGTEDQVVAADEHRRLREAIAQLPEDQREALVMTQLERVSYAKAAEMLGVTEGTVKSRVNRAKARLKEILTEAARKNGELSSSGNVQKKEGRERP